MPAMTRMTCVITMPRVTGRRSVTRVVAMRSVTRAIAVRSVSHVGVLRHAVRPTRAVVTRVLVVRGPVSRRFGHNLLHPPKAI